MTDGGPRKPGESERDYMNRLRDHAAALERNRNRIKRGDPRGIEGEIGRINDDDRLLDNLGSKGGKGTGDELSQLLGAWRDDIDSEPLADLTQHMSDKAAADLAAYRSTKSKGKRKRLAKKNKAAWKDAAKKNKNGCAVVAVALLGAAGGALYGLFEAGRTIVSALGY